MDQCKFEPFTNICDQFPKIMPDKQVKIEGKWVKTLVESAVEIASITDMLCKLL